MTLLRQRPGTRPQQSSLSTLGKPIRGPAKTELIVTQPKSRLSIQAGQLSLALALYKQTQISPSEVEFSVPYVDGGDVVIETAPFGTYIPSTTAIIELVELVNDELLLRKYSFNRQATRYVLEGEDDSPLRRTLRIGINEQVRLVVDGVELDSSSYIKQLNKLTLTPPISDSIIDVYVYRDAATTSGKIVPLTFECPSITGALDIEHRKLSSWGRSVSTESDLGFRVTAYSFGVDLDKAKTYLFRRAYVITGSGEQIALNLSQVALLIGSPPYAFEDKRIDQYVTLENLASERISLQAYPDGSHALSVSETAFTDTIKLIREVQQLSLEDVTSQTVSLLPKAQARYTIGPV